VNVPTRTCVQLLESRDVVIQFVDVGARNGVTHLPGLASRIDAYGLEPNPEEYEKLVTGSTDAARQGVISPTYRTLQYFSHALGDAPGEQTFYHRHGAGMAGMLVLDRERLSEIQTHAGNTRFSDRISEIDTSAFDERQAIKVETITLDAFLEKNSISNVDYLKIDVEGFEYQVLEGASPVLDRVGVVVVETCFVPVRVGQKLFSDVDQLLRGSGFDLIRFEIDQEQLGYKTLKAPTHYVPPGYSDPYGQPLVSDAVYVNRSVSDPDRCLAQGAILIEKRFVDEGVHILRHKAGVDEETCALLADPTVYFSSGERARHRGYRMVDQLMDRVGRAKRRAFGLMGRAGR